MSDGTPNKPASFGELLRRYRAATHLTQEELAARASLSPDAIAALERGKRRTPRGAGAGQAPDAARRYRRAAGRCAGVGGAGARTVRGGGASSFGGGGERRA
jgi:hypothetical protein